MTKIEKIKILRAESSVSIKLCQKALEESNDDLEKARVALKEITKDIGLKKEDRKTLEGLIHMENFDEGKIYFSIISCETDFVAKNESFQNMCKNIMYAYLNNQDQKEIILQEIGKVGENIQVQMQAIIEKGEFYIYNPYNKCFGKKAAIINLKNNSCSKDCLLQLICNPTNNIEEFLEQDFIKDESKKMKDVIGKDNQITYLNYLSI
jgi:elongation factor Ts